MIVESTLLFIIIIVNCCHFCHPQLDEDTFRISFKNALQYLFTFGESSSNVDRVIQFVATFCTSFDDTEEEFLLFVFEVIFDVSIWLEIESFSEYSLLQSALSNYKYA